MTKPKRSEEEILKEMSQELQTNFKNSEGIKSGLIKQAALGLFRLDTRGSDIARILIQGLVSNGKNKETRISKQLIYKVLQMPEFRQRLEQERSKK